MTDDEFLRAFQDGTIPPDRFRHRDHLRAAWLLIHRLGCDEARLAVAAGIRQITVSHGHTDKYHETMTQFWVHLVDHMSREQPEILDFDRFLSAFPQLADKHLPLRHWNRDTLFSPAARAGWIEPDLRALPAAMAPGR